MDMKEQLRKDLTSRKLELCDLPVIMKMSSDGVFVHRDGPKGQDLMRSLRSHGQDWALNKIKLEKLEVDSDCWGFNFAVAFVETRLFESRSQFNEFFSYAWSSQDPKANYERGCSNYRAEASLEQILDYFNLLPKCSMKYYEEHRDELENDLGRRVEDGDLASEDLQRQITARSWASLFKDLEEGIEPEDTLTFTDFEPHWDSGNDKYASATRGKYFFTFTWEGQ